MSKVTLSLLKKIFPGTPNAKLERFVVPFNTILPKYGIITKLRFAAFIANVGIESDRLKALEEYASGAAYEGRAGLGNVLPGDGVRFKGRSVLQNTGRYNYWKVVVAYLRVLTGKNWYNKQADTNFKAYLKTKDYDDLLKEADKYNVNFLANPELLEKFPHAVEAACVFVEDNKLNNYADKGQFRAYAGVLNTGSPRKKAMHLNLREDLYDLALRVIPENFELDGTTDKVAKTGSSEPDESNINSEDLNNVTVKDAESVTINDAGAGDANGTVKIEVGDTGAVKVETSQGTPTIKEKVAVIKAKPIGFFRGIGAKITGLITGNALFAWLADKLETLQTIALSPMTWKIIVGIAVLGSLIWIVDQILDNRAARKKQKEMEQLLVEQNSTADNLISTVPYEDAELFKLKGYRIIRSGESLPGDTEENLPK